MPGEMPRTLTSRFAAFSPNGDVTKGAGEKPSCVGDVYGECECKDVNSQVVVEIFGEENEAAEIIVLSVTGSDGGAESICVLLSHIVDVYVNTGCEPEQASKDCGLP
ncbi:hypothetical protein EV192_103660 [Actinocrispum wychmicini]|uniref:Uncharacterized protein n=1 Tax=Actinocrispum wychmicini TaxID=1213861 RepID=A0A4R2JUW7_9PSEU|nr:hypothetical protein EV192_103660 [Actinocrispum wychmicini]